MWLGKDLVASEIARNSFLAATIFFDVAII
jgi:hypothetical protein